MYLFFIFFLFYIFMYFIHICILYIYVFFIFLYFLNFLYLCILYIYVFYIFMYFLYIFYILYIFIFYIFYIYIYFIWSGTKRVEGLDDGNAATSRLVVGVTPFRLQLQVVKTWWPSAGKSESVDDFLSRKKKKIYLYDVQDTRLYYLSVC